MATITRNDLATILRDGEEVKVAGFGTFKILDKSARVGRNPKTGEMAIVTARRVVSFRPCAEFRELVSQKC